MSDRPDENDNDLADLNPEGAGLGAGSDNSFEPEEDEDAPVEGKDDA
ncbi:hypothetical protein [Granulicoccus sp. GXG6511]